MSKYLCGDCGEQTEADTDNAMDIPRCPDCGLAMTERPEGA